MFETGVVSAPGAVVPARGKSHYLFTAALFVVLFTPVLLHSVFGIALSPVLSGSMRPVFNPGDALITKEVKAQELHIGDIVVLRNAVDYTLFSHRITSVKNINFEIVITTKGDNNPVADAGAVKVNPLQMLPKVEGHIPFIGRAVVFFTSNKGRLISYTLILLAFLMTVARYFSRRVLAKHHALQLHVAQNPDIQHTSSSAEAPPIESESSPAESRDQSQTTPTHSTALIDQKGDDV